MSGNTHNKAHVLNINDNFTRILGFQKQQIVDFNIKLKIMPKIFANIHDQLVSEFLETSRENIIGKERYIMPLNIDGYIVPSILMIKILPTLDYGI